MALALLLGAGAAALTATSAPPRPARTTRPGPSPAPHHDTVARLVSYDGCGQMLDDLRTRALASVAASGLPLDAVGVAAGGVGASVSGVASSAGATAAPAAAAGPSYSATNDQEAAVDEPDVVKTDGHVMVVLRHQPGNVGVQVAAVGQGGSRLQGWLPLPQLQSHEMLLTGTYAVVIGTATSLDRSPAQPYRPTTTAVVVSLADPQRPAVARTFTLDGYESAARLIGGRVTLVLTGGPRLQPAYAAGFGSSASQTQVVTADRAVIEESTPSQWLPGVRSSSGQSWTTGCSQTDRDPATAGSAESGVGMVSVVNLDPASDQPGREVTVVGDGGTVYASATSLYLAVARTSYGGGSYGGGNGGLPEPYPPSVDTTIHDFDLTDPVSPRYVGSGDVPGSLIGQYAMSEYQGRLRVATTVGWATPPPMEGDVPAQLSDNRVTVLAPSGGSLVSVGSVTGLGAGEKIYGVRFEGPLGFVVTFRQTDPLYTVDLSDPAHPGVRGQLSLTGYSSLLQPLGGGLLAGIGQAVDGDYRQSGLQISVFDVTDPANSVLKAKVVVPAAFSAAQQDPHALLWWAARRILVLPVSGGGESPGALAVWQVGTDGTLTRVATLTPPPSSPPDPAGQPLPAGRATSSVGSAIAAPAPGYYYGDSPVRATVVGNLLYLTSDAGIMAADMDTWARAAWLPFT